MYELATKWIEMGATVSVFHTVGSREDAQLSPPPGVAVLGGTTSRLRYALPRLFLGLLAATRRHDVLIVGTTGISAVAGYLAARLGRRRIVAYSQGVIDRSLQIYQHHRSARRAIRWCVPRMDAVFCVSPISAAAAIRFGASPERVAELRTGIDIDRVRARAKEAVAPIDAGHGRRLLVAVGRLEHQKGYDRLLRAMADVTAEDASVHLLLIGPDGGARAALEERRRELRIEDHVTFLGPVENPLPYVARADLFVHPARSEILGLVLMEALALGTPVVAHDCPAGGPRLVLRDGELGTLVDASVPGALPAAIRTALCQEPDRDARVLDAEAHLRDGFSVEAAATLGHRLLQHVAAGVPLGADRPPAE